MLALLSLPEANIVPLAAGPRMEWVITDDGVSDGPRTPAEHALRVAMDRLVDKAFVFGGDGPEGYGQTPIVRTLYRRIGMDIRAAYSEKVDSKTTQKVITGPLRFGDVLYMLRPGRHVMVYAGGGRVFHSLPPQSGFGDISLTSWPGKVVEVRRFLLGPNLPSRRIATPKGAR